MHLTGRIRRLLSASSGPARTSGRRSDISEDSSISYDRSSGSFVQRVTTSLRSKGVRRRRAASEGGHLQYEDSFDGSSLFPEEASIRQLTPPKYTPQLPPIVAGSVSFASTPPPPAGVVAVASLRDTPPAGGEDSIAWEDGPSPQERQKSQDIVVAWLDTSRETATALLEIPEDTELPPVRQPLRMLDAISEDEVPDFIASTLSTAPSTPMLHSVTRSRSRSPPQRRRSLEGQEEFPMRGLDTIQEAGDPDPVSPSARRRSLESAKKPPLESIPEFESTSPKRHLVLRGLGLQRSESEPVIAHNRQSTKTKTPGMLSISAISSSKPIKSAAAVFPRSSSSPTLQRDAPPLTGQHSKSSPGPRRPLNPTLHSLGSVAIQASIIEDDESRRLTEVAYLG